VVTTSNYYTLFNGILNPKQLEGLRLLLTPLRAAAVSTRRRIAAANIQVWEWRALIAI